MHRKETANMKIEDYIKSTVGKSQGNQYVLFLGGRVNSEDYHSSNAVRRAIKNIQKFSVIGFVEDLQGFVDRYYDKYQVKLDIIKTNKNPRPTAWVGQNITDSIRTKIENICENDCEIYHKLKMFLKCDY